jgi:hypothetical protein
VSPTRRRSPSTPTPASPLGLTGGPAGGKVAVSVTYLVTRGKLADIAAGKF